MLSKISEGLEETILGIYQTNMAVASKLTPILALLKSLFEGYFIESWNQIKIAM